jgi:hypothetical protein
VRSASRTDSSTSGEKDTGTQCVLSSGESQSKSGRFEEEKSLLSFSRIELWIVQFVAFSLYWLRIWSNSGDLVPNTRLKKRNNWKVASFRDDYWTKEKAKLYVTNTESLPQKFYACRWSSIGRVVSTRRPPWKQKLTSKQWNHGSMLRSNSHHASRHKKMCRLWSYLGKQIRYPCEHIQQSICFIGSV